MPWIFETIDPAGGRTFGIEAKAWHRRPNFIPDSEPFYEIAVPDDMAGVDEIPTDFEHEGVRYITGGWTQNALVTRDLALWSLGIEPPPQIPSVAAQGTGITAEVICYWSFADDATNERSPLSAGSTLNLANQGVRWSNFPTSVNPRVTHLELWRSVDGSLPRLVLRRQIGVTGNIDENVDAGDLGEAFTEDFSKFPRCRVNAFYHNRQYMAGYERDRTVIYASLIDFPERMSSIDLRTKNGEPVVGLDVVNDYLLVFCPFSIYVVTGFTEDDIQLQVLKTDVGLISPNAKTLVQGNLHFYTHQGPYVTDGSSVFFIGRDIQPRYVQEFRIGVTQESLKLLSSAASLRRYERAWLVNNVNAYCTLLYVEGHTDTDGLFTFWAAHYEIAGPTADGGYTQPLWSYDTSIIDYTCGGILRVPGSRQQELFYGSTFSNTGAYLLRQNVFTVYDQTTLQANPAPVDHDNMLLRFAAEFHEDVGGDIAHGKRFTDLDLYLTSWNADLTGQDAFTGGFTVRLWTGGTYAGLQAVALNYALGGDTDVISFDPSFERSVTTEPVTQNVDWPVANVPRTVVGQQPQSEWHFKLARAVGDAAALELECRDRFCFFSGYGVGWKIGPKYWQRASITIGD